MKSFVGSIFILVFLLLLPAAGNCDYIIHLKNGGRFLTPHYWEQGQEILFYTSTGILGVEKQSVRKIEQTDEVLSLPSSIPEPAPDAAAGEASEEVKAAADEEELDIEAYQAKMEQLKAALNGTLRQIRVATENNDQDGLNKAREENRAISDEMYRLTDELKEKNQGELLPGWWEGIGREEEPGAE